MKRIGCLLTICLALTGSMSASETNVVYLPVDSKAYFGDQAQAIATTEELQKAKNSNESQPAGLDPSGHWGKVAGGVQMSLRFPTNVFFSGTPVSATVLVRNTTTNSIILPSPQDAAIKFVVRDSRGNLLPNLTKKIIISGPASLRLPEYRQLKFSFNLDRMFTLTNPGFYHISAQKILVADSGKPTASVSSGEARIEIVDKQ